LISIINHRVKMSFINKDIIEESINKINEVEVKSFMVNNRLLQYYQF